jgi:hypothetical protein
MLSSIFVERERDVTIHTNSNYVLLIIVLPNTNLGNLGRKVYLGLSSNSFGIMENLKMVHLHRERERERERERGFVERKGNVKAHLVVH